MRLLLLVLLPATLAIDCPLLPPAGYGYGSECVALELDGPACNQTCVNDHVPTSGDGVWTCPNGQRTGNLVCEGYCREPLDISNSARVCESGPALTTCNVTCNEGFAATQPQIQCRNGRWPLNVRCEPAQVLNRVFPFPGCQGTPQRQTWWDSRAGGCQPAYEDGELVFYVSNTICTARSLTYRKHEVGDTACVDTFTDEQETLQQCNALQTWTCFGWVETPTFAPPTQHPTPQPPPTPAPAVPLVLRLTVLYSSVSSTTYMNGLSDDITSALPANSGSAVVSAVVAHGLGSLVTVLVQSQDMRQFVLRESKDLSSALFDGDHIYSRNIDSTYDPQATGKPKFVYGFNALAATIMGVMLFFGLVWVSLKWCGGQERFVALQLSRSGSSTGGLARARHDPRGSANNPRGLAAQANAGTGTAPGGYTREDDADVELQPVASRVG